MNTNANKQRKGGRVAPGRRSKAFDKSIMNEGIYSNSRIIHTSLLLVGCNVQVQVRNGGLYEGVFKTMSPEGTIALEMAHKVDPGSKEEVPRRDRVIPSIVFSLEDIVQISATGVDLDYALKDNFTDSAISSKINNGGNSEKELQPWEAEPQEGGDLETLEKEATGVSATGVSTNGWDAEDMFNTNANKFDIKSSYDPDLTQYTTPLLKQDTKEYRDREMRAARLANEIEKTEEHTRYMELENGEGDDEEMTFSAVHRPGEQPGKYVPPHLRKGQQNRPARQSTPQGGSPSPHAQSPSPHQQPSPVRTVPVTSAVSGHATMQQPQHVQNPHGQPVVHAQPPVSHSQPPAQHTQHSQPQASSVPHTQSAHMQTHVPSSGTQHLVNHGQHPNPGMPPQRSPNQPAPVQVSVSTAVAASDDAEKAKKKKVPTATLH